MSLWSRDQLRIALAPHGLALLRHHGNPGKPVASKAVPCETRDWQSLMPLLERELADPAWRGARAEVVLSNQYVRYVLTPAPGKALSRLEEEGLVAASFREIYGVESTGWRIRVQSQPPQFGLLGAAIDESLAIQVGDVMKRQHYTDWAFSPLASVVAQRHAQAADWWVLERSAERTLMARERRQWIRVCEIGTPRGSDRCCSKVESRRSHSAASSAVCILGRYKTIDAPDRFRF